MRLASQIEAGPEGNSAVLGFRRDDHHNPSMAASELLPVSLDPDPVIEAYMKDVDRTLLRENLKLTVEQRILKMIAALRLVEEIQRSRRTTE
jgi:hypothetical protein